jgi:hypothetical protein
MSRLEIGLLSISSLMVGGTGLLLYVMKNWMEPVDPFAAVNHPWQPVVLKLHLLTAPLLIFAVGMVSSGHVARKMRGGTRTGRFTGMSLVLLFLPLTVSGVLIQVLIRESWLAAAVWTHLLAGILFLMVFAGHRVATVRGLRRSPAAGRSRPGHGVSPRRVPSGPGRVMRGRAG